MSASTCYNYPLYDSNGSSSGYAVYSGDALAADLLDSYALLVYNYS
ncbi:hypothetical protein ACE3MZ_01760 [Paenibacillus sp. WLX1005]